MKKIGVILSGCGVYDGSEIHEAVLTLLALSSSGAEAVILAPNREQHHVISHDNGEEMPEQRNILREAARIARGEVSDLATASSTHLDGVIIPGGFGAAKNLSSFAFDGANAKVDPDVHRIVTEMHAAKKPIGALCIAPALLALILGEKQISITIGSDAETAGAIEKTGAKHISSSATEIVTDEKNTLVTTAAYMCEASIAEINEGISKCVSAVLERA